MQPLQMLLYLFLYIYIALKLSRQSLTPLSKHPILLKILNQWQILEDIFKLTLKDNEIKVHNNNLAEKKIDTIKLYLELARWLTDRSENQGLVFCTNWKFWQAVFLNFNTFLFSETSKDISTRLFLRRVSLSHFIVFTSQASHSAFSYTGVGWRTLVRSFLHQNSEAGSYLSLDPMSGAGCWSPAPDKGRVWGWVDARAAMEKSDMGTSEFCFMRDGQRGSTSSMALPTLTTCISQALLIHEIISLYTLITDYKVFSWSILFLKYSVDA